MQKIIIPSICTYCGKCSVDVGPLDGDHPIPTCIWVGDSRDRPPKKAKACRRCNGCANEGLLKSFMAVFDPRLIGGRVEHFKHPKGKVDFRRFMAACSGGSRLMAYADEAITAIFKKMFMGLRRHLLKADWTYLDSSDFAIIQVEKLPRLASSDDAEEFATVLRPWPLRVGGANRGVECPPAFAEDFEAGGTETFREFTFGMFDYVSPENMAMVLRFNMPVDSANKLHLLCGVGRFGA